MKYILVDDEHELYKTMFADVLNNADVDEIPKFKISTPCFNVFRKVYFSEKINRHFMLPQGGLWDGVYSIFSYPFECKEEYALVFLNGTIRNYYSRKTLIKFKSKHRNVKLVMLMYDSMASQNIYRYRDKFDVFDAILTFDPEDAKKYGFVKMNPTFSCPSYLSVNSSISSDAFFIGYAGNRLDILHSCYEKLISKLRKVDFRIVGVEDDKMLKESKIVYNTSLSYHETLQREYNTSCIVEVLKPGQSGPTLRMCEAIVFGKRLLTNNKYILELPFYDPRYIHYFETADKIDLSFFDEDKIAEKVVYAYNDEFSPKKVLLLIKETLKGNDI